MADVVLPLGSYSVLYFRDNNHRTHSADKDVSAAYVATCADEGEYAIATHNNSGRVFRVAPNSVRELFPPAPEPPEPVRREIAWVCDAKSGDGLRTANESDLARGLAEEAAGHDTWPDYDGRLIHLGLRWMTVDA
jgi:hypothetical protein